jgi:hypothetical protein
MSTAPEKLPCVTINTDGVVRIFDGEKFVELPYKDYLISIQSGKSPFSRVFLPPVPRIEVIGGPLEEG